MQKKSGKRPPFYSRKLLVNHKIQFGIMLYSLFLVVSVSILNRIIDVAISNRIYTEFNQEQGLPLGVLLAFSILILALAIGYGFHLSNKIVGPIYRLQQHFLEAASNPEIPKLQIRKEDYFQEIVEPYNQLLESRRNKS